MYGAIGSVLVFSTLVVAPISSASAQTCPAFYNFGGQFPLPHFTTHHTSDVDTKNDVGFSHTFSEGGYSVTIDSEASIKTNVFSQIFLNYYNVIGAFTSTTVNDPQFSDRWKTYCISRDGIGKGSFTVSETGVIRYLKTTKRTLSIGESIPSSASGCDTVIANGIVDDGELCEVDEEKPTDSNPIDDSDRKDFAIPYPNGLRELARKIPSVISNDTRYCNPGDPTSFCSAGYSCQEIPPAALPFFPDIGTFKGICATSPDVAVTTASLPFPANLLCSEENISPPATTLSSKVCYDEPPIEPKYTQQQFENPESTVLVDPAKLPFLKIASIHAPTNEIGFDTEAAELYFSRAFGDKLGIYSPDDLKWMKDLPAQMHFSLSTKSGTTSTGNGPFSTDDYIDKLGGYAEISADSRFMNPDVLPIGASVVTAGNHSAYLRAGNERAGALFVDGQPVGHRLGVAQHWPTITERAGHLAVAVEVYKNPDNKKGFFIATNELPNGPLLPIVKVADGEFYGTPAVFIRKNGEKIAFTNVGGVYKYFNSINGVFKENTTANAFLGNRVKWAVRFASDNDDNIHLLWCDDDNCPRVLYSKLAFDEVSRTLKTVVESEKVPFSASTVGLVNTIPFTIQTDNQGNVLVGGRLGSNDDNSLVFLARSPLGQWSPEELITKRITTRKTEFETWANNASPKIATVTDVNGNTATFVVYTVYSSIPRGDGNHQFVQIYYSIRSGPIGGPGKWSKPIKTSDEMDLDWQTRISDEGIDKTAQISFTVQERTAKYNVNTRLFDAPGVKMCITGATGIDNLHCGINYNGSGVGFVFPPTETTDKKMHVINPHTGAEML